MIATTATAHAVFRVMMIVNRRRRLVVRDSTSEMCLCPLRHLNDL